MNHHNSSPYPFLLYLFHNQKILDVYKYFDGETKQLRADLCTMKAEQGVINANLMAGVDVLKSQAEGTRAILAGITRTAVPSNVICDMCCNPCNTGCGNV